MYFLKDKIQLGSRDPLMLAYFEQIMNGVVYELYFPEEDRLQRLRTLFEILYDGTHPIRITIAKLQTFDTARIIEGKA